MKQTMSIAVLIAALTATLCSAISTAQESVSATQRGTPWITQSPAATPPRQASASN